MSDADPPREIDVLRALCALEQIEDPGSRAFTAGPGPWPLEGFLVRLGTAVHAYQNRCPHAGHRLNLRPHDFMTRDRLLVICSSHAARFDPATGMCVAGPCAGASLRRVPIELRAGYVLLGEGVDPADYAD
jgi:nitrite reductase/ring-hydroxylating ferredoxin subunit